MKKILVFLLCITLLCTMPIVAFADGESADVVVEEGASESVPEETVTEMIVGYVKEHFEEISVVATLILMAFYDRLTRRKLSGTIGTLNNNAITVAENSATVVKDAFAKTEEVVQKALDKVEVISASVQTSQERIDDFLDEIRSSEEEKKALKEALARAESFLNTAKLANVEFANELAELLCLANIPTSKKEELYARHIQSVRLLEASEDKEVKTDDGKEA